jgi:2-amino-4-hydroxy-6-hydroxymethyldihydropteridine diphosphokinase
MKALTCSASSELNEGMRVYLGLGGNIDGPVRHLAAARRALEQGEVRIRICSALYETEPVGNPDQPWFVNQAVMGETDLSPLELLRLARKIEAANGRRPGPRNGPRPLDIDILLMEDVFLDTPTLTIPHPRMAERRFVLVPLAEIAPRLRHPVLGLTMTRLLRECPDRSAVRPVSRLKKRP